MINTPEPIETVTRREITRREWEAFFQQFTRDHQEWSVDVAGQGKGTKPSHEANGLPFEALALHLDHTDEVLSILVRKDDVAQEHVYLSIPRPRRVMIEETGSDVRLHVDSMEGSSAIIRFRRVATPDYNSEATSGTPEREEKMPIADRGKAFSDQSHVD